MRVFPLPAAEAADEPLLDCRYFQAGMCNSCTLLGTPQNRQLAAKQERAESLVAARRWEEPVASARQAFRNKVKLVVTGSVEAPKLGILGPDGDGQDLRDCPLPTAGIQLAIPALADFITACGLQPYDPRTNTGTLKYVIVTESPSGELMVRFVAKRRGVRGILFKKLPELREALPNVTVVSLNVQPEHKAIIEGSEEILITPAGELPMPVRVAGRDLELALRPQSFFQTNTDAAEHLYTQAASWLKGARTAWDLYSGVGAFAFALAAQGTEVVGVETSPQAVESANTVRLADSPEVLQPADSPDASRPADRQSAAQEPAARFVTADATEWAAAAFEAGECPDVVVVNPPRRGIGHELASLLERSDVKRVLYSSCNVDSLARDLADMPGFEVERAQVVDMFPHTKHFETICLLTRAAA